MKGQEHRASEPLAPHVQSTPPKSGLPTSQQPQQLNNGAVWLQALTLHRASLEAPIQHSCPQWRLPAKGPASSPATHLPGAEAQGPTLLWLAQTETLRKAWTETRGGISIPHFCLSPLPMHKAVSSCSYTHTHTAQVRHRDLPKGLHRGRGREGRGNISAP